MTPDTYGEHPTMLAVKKLLAEIMVELKRQNMALDKIANQLEKRKDAK